jgi:hypothetical protein
MRDSLLLMGLLPELAQLAIKHQILCKRENVDWMMVQGFRTPEQQLGYYASGRKKLLDGTWEVVDKTHIITNALPEKDPHCKRTAYDIAILVDGHINWEAIALYNKAGKLGEEVGLVWGGEFKSIHDLGHFELKNWRNL